MNIKDVCLKCVPPKRHSGCHGTCKEYLDAKAELEEKKEAARKQLQYEMDFEAFRNEGLKKAMKRRKDVK